MDPNLALLTGEILGALSLKEGSFPKLRPLLDTEGNYTNKMLIDRNSGTYCVTVIKVDEDGVIEG